MASGRQPEGPSQSRRITQWPLYGQKHEYIKLIHFCYREYRGYRVYRGYRAYSVSTQIYRRPPKLSPLGLTFFEAQKIPLRSTFIGPQITPSYAE